MLPTPDILVVTGLPRSGTSMIMQMLEAGGAALLTDSIRAPDVDNPRGYFEFEPVKTLLRDASWLASARGRAVKVVAPLACALHAGFSYRVILMERDYREILASQMRMLARKGKDEEASPEIRASLLREFERTIENTKTTLASRPDVRLLLLRYDDVLNHPVEAAQRIAEFAGGSLDITKMAAAVDPSLGRNTLGGPLYCG